MYKLFLIRGGGHRSDGGGESTHSGAPIDTKLRTIFERLNLSLVAL